MHVGTALMCAKLFFPYIITLSCKCSVQPQPPVHSMFHHARWHNRKSFCAELLFCNVITRTRTHMLTCPPHPTHFQDPTQSSTPTARVQATSLQRNHTHSHSLANLSSSPNPLPGPCPVRHAHRTFRGEASYSVRHGSNTW